MTLRRLSLILLVAAAAVAYRVQACELDPVNYWNNNFSPNYRANVNTDLGDYGLIFQDSLDRNCSGGASNPPQGAYRALITKINTTFSYTEVGCGNVPGMHNDVIMQRCVGPFQGWLDGANVSLIFASALLIGGHGDLKTELDQALIRVRDAYTGAKSPTCGFNTPSGWFWGTSDTCMDDHAIAAAGWSWIALYERRRGRDTTYFASQARAEVTNSFSTYDSVCIYDDQQDTDSWGRGPCNVNVAGLDEATQFSTLSSKILPVPGGHAPADILALNHTGENIVYGAGLMTSISAAFVALDEGGFFPSLTRSQQVIAAAFMDEAQRKTDPSGTYFKGGSDAPPGTADCASFTAFNNIAVRNDGILCADGDHRPKVFALNTTSPITAFYPKYVPYIPAVGTIYDHANGVYTAIPNPYQFNMFWNGYFTHDATNCCLNWGRQVYYHYLGWGWNTIDTTRDAATTDHTSGDKRPRLWGYLDDHDPIGYVDGIDANGVVSGWTCDQDLPTWQNAVDFYVNGTSGNYITRAFATVGSEAAVNSQCGGGTAHRFSVQLPSWTKGQLVYAYGLDATWRGIALLNGWQCPQHPACSW